MGEKRRQFTREFKFEAVRLVTEDGRSVADVARELGIRADMLRAWRRQIEGGEARPATEVFPGNGNVTGQEAEMARLRRENARLAQENQFLKKAAAYFAKESR